ncbi:hypothetical protein [Rhizobium sp. Leaf262]|uniref:hypothetical protein n=1 Tax=Rhizobium sp. Leaf262 TaxID=1736312 RepID=UPI0012E79972|nr:hypothetical protein [Rhizobium sp. Leaf262]
MTIFLISGTLVVVVPIGTPTKEKSCSTAATSQNITEHFGRVRPAREKYFGAVWRAKIDGNAEPKKQKGLATFSQGLCTSEFGWWA